MLLAFNSFLITLHWFQYVEYGARSLEPPNRPQGPIVSSLLTGPIMSTDALGPSPMAHSTPPVAAIVAAAAAAAAAAVSEAAPSAAPSTTTSSSHGAIARPGGASMSKVYVIKTKNYYRFCFCYLINFIWVQIPPSYIKQPPSNLSIVFFGTIFLSILKIKRCTNLKLHFYWPVFNIVPVKVAAL